MAFFLTGVFVATFLLIRNVQASVSGVNGTVSKPELSEDGVLKPLSSVEMHTDMSPALQPSSLWHFFSLGLASAFPEDLEFSDYCLDLLRIFGQRYVMYASCLVSSSRPVKVCQNCYGNHNSLKEIFNNISSSDQQGPGNVSCQDSLMRSDRLMLLYTLNANMDDIWSNAKCVDCLTDHNGLTNDTLYFLTALNQSLTCFEKYQQGNDSDLCKECKATYKGLNELYSRMEKNKTLCIDLEDAMNVTRKLWSKTFNCSFPREETVPVIAVSSFMLFLPIIFYLSSFLHSEQKKRKLVHTKRAKSNHSLMNIQDKFS